MFFLLKEQGAIKKIIKIINSLMANEPNIPINLWKKKLQN